MAGATKETVAPMLPEGTAETAVGAPGFNPETGVTALLAAEDKDSPIPLIATTVNV